MPPPSKKAHRPAHAILPGKLELELLYVRDNLSFNEIGAKYGVSGKTVYNCMVRRARKAGTEWPLKKNRNGWGQRMSAKRWDTITSAMVRAEILHCCEKYGVTQLDIDRIAGTWRGHCHRITGPKGKERAPRMSRASAEKIMHGIVKIERGAR